MSDEGFERGLAIRKAVLGDDHVARAQADTSSLDADFQRFITEVAWGGVWARPGLDRRTRHLQVAIYAGVPSANAAFAAAKRVLGEAAAPATAEPGR
jgi:alkylhydroperoxidase/carboxymuconolactone decarboxylase family protein YurZ